MAVSEMIGASTDRWTDILPSLPRSEHLSNFSPYAAIATLLLFAGIYTDVPFAAAGGTIPMVSALPGLFLLGIWRQTWSGRTFFFLAAPGFAFLAMSLLAPNSAEALPLRINATAQFTLSLAIGYVAANALLKAGADRLHRALGIILPIFVGLLLLEIFTPFREVVKSYLSVYPRNYDFLALAVREGNMGGYRPKLFTSETSYVAMSSVILLTAYVWTGRKAQRYFHALIYTLVLAAIVRSPITLLALPIILVSALTDRGAGRLNAMHAVALGFAVIIASAALMVAGSEIMEARLKRISSGADYSTTYRTYGSLAVGWRVASEYPLFGIGPGSLDPARDIIVSTQASFGAPEQAILREWRVSVNNAAASSLVYFGFVGTMLVCSAIFAFVTVNVEGSRVAVLSALLFLSATSGAIYTPKYAATFIILVALAMVREAVWISRGRSSL